MDPDWELMLETSIISPDFALLVNLIITELWSKIQTIKVINGPPNSIHQRGKKQLLKHQHYSNKQAVYALFTRQSHLITTCISGCKWVSYVIRLLMVIDWSLSIRLTSHILDTRLHRRSTMVSLETKLFILLLIVVEKPALFRIALIGGGRLL